MLILLVTDGMVHSSSSANKSFAKTFTQAICKLNTFLGEEITLSTSIQQVDFQDKSMINIFQQMRKEEVATAQDPRTESTTEKRSMKSDFENVRKWSFNKIYLRIKLVRVKSKTSICNGYRILNYF